MWPRSVGDAPVPHDAGWIMGDDLLETANRFLMVEGIGPDKAPVEPCLGMRASGCRLASERA